MSSDAGTVPTGTPPAWVNRMMIRMLRTPGLQRMIGQGVALITVTGRKTGTEYTIPVSYHRDEDTVLVLTKRARTWWRNLEANPEVQLRLAGKQYWGRARLLLDGDPEALEHLAMYGEHLTRDAKMFGLTLTSDGKLDEGRARAVLPEIVIIRITLNEGSGA